MSYSLFTFSDVFLDLCQLLNARSHVTHPLRQVWTTPLNLERYVELDYLRQFLAEVDALCDSYYIEGLADPAQFVLEHF